MKYEGKRSVLVIEGSTQGFPGETMAGGIVILLDLKGQGNKTNFTVHRYKDAPRRIYLLDIMNSSQNSSQTEYQARPKV